MASRARWVLTGCVLLAAVVSVLLWVAALEGRRLFNADTLKSRLVAEMSRQLDSDVSLDHLELGVFPVLRLRGSGLRVEPRGGGAGRRIPTITVREFTVKPGWSNLLHGRAELVEVDGLQLTILPRTGSRPPASAAAKPARPEPSRGAGSPGAPRSSVPIDRVKATNSEVVFVRARPDQAPRVFQLHELTLDAVAADAVMGFRATLTNPVPAGRVEIAGRLGPWNAAAAGETFIAGDYIYTHADFDTIDGLGGTLSSTGRFEGPLVRLVVDGSSSTPDFQLDRSGHAVPLNTVFRAIVDSSNGDVQLERVDATLGTSRIAATGTVTTTPGVRGHRINMRFSVPQGRIEDFLKLTLPAPRPMLTGALTLSAALQLPPGQGRVIDRLSVDEGKFNLTGAVFTSAEVQKRMDGLSRIGQGLARDQPPVSVAAAFQGRFAVANGLVSLPEVALIVPGARVGLSGGYQMGGGAIDLQGELRLDANISRAAGGGMKSFLLTAIDPLFQKPGSAHGTTVPIRISGTHEHPAFKLDFRRLMGGR